MASFISPSCVFRNVTNLKTEYKQDVVLIKREHSNKHKCDKGTGKRGHIVAHDVSSAAQTGKHLLRTQNVSKQNQKHFLCPGRKFCVRNKCCARGQRGNICVGNNMSSFARALIITSKNVVCRLNE